MREIQYETFSLRTHIKNCKAKRPNVCQFELTFGCGLRCKHCYTDCYNNSEDIRRELSVRGIKLILDKIYKAGCIWLCFTGGDPLSRRDFLEIYSYAKNKGFIVSVFTNAYSINNEIVGYFRRKTPFVVEVTLNAVNRDVYEKISQVKGSFEKAMRGIDMMFKAGIPLKIKTQVLKDNLKELPKIQDFIEGLGLKFMPTTELFPRLNGDLEPCNSRVSADDVLALSEDNKRRPVNGCQGLGEADYDVSLGIRRSKAFLFNCAIGGGDGILVDPYGNTFPCELIRNPSYNLLEVGFEYALSNICSSVRGKKINSDSECKDCSLKESCNWCPGKALLEEGDMEFPVRYYCQLARIKGINETVSV